MKWLSYSGSAVCLLLIVQARMAFGVDLLVPAEYSTISAAMNAAVPGDVVEVAPGSYIEGVTIPAGVSLVSASGRELTQIVPNGPAAVTFAPVLPSANGGFSTVCRGFSLSNLDEWGSGIVVSFNADAVVEDCRVGHGFNADNPWPMIYLTHGGVLRGCTLDHFSKQTMLWTSVPGAQVLVEDCIIDGVMTGEWGLCCQASGSHTLYRNNTIVSTLYLSFHNSASTDYTVEFVDNIFYDTDLDASTEGNYVLPDSLSIRNNVYWDCTFPSGNGPGSFFVNGVGNFEADPLFCEEPLTFWLEPESPCLGAGETGGDIGARYGICATTNVDPPSHVSSPPAVVVWPNPSSGPIRIELSEDLSDLGVSLEASIVGVDGRQLADLGRVGSNGQVAWSGSSPGGVFPNGSYFVVLRDADGVVSSTKFVLAR